MPLVHNLTERQYRLLLFVQGVVDSHRPSALPPLGDLDVAEAAAALAATLETERRGIIYEHRAPSLPAQRLEAELKTALDSQRAKGSSALDRDIISVLRRIERAAREARHALEGGETAYLDFVSHLLRQIASRSTPEDVPVSPTEQGSGLIIP